MEVHKPRILLENVVKYYGDRRVLDNITFSIDGNGVTGLLGPNGAGKTTTMRLIAGVISQDSGRIEVAGKPVSVETKKITGYLPESILLYDNLRVIELLEFIAAAYDMDKELAQNEITRWADRLGIEKYLDLLIGTLSKGIKQKVAIVSVLIHKPEILLLDEPFINLDPVNTGVVMDILNELRKSSCVILSTHLLYYAERLCDNIIVISDGKIVDIGKLSELRKKSGKKNLENVFRQLVAEKDGN